jgi:hypothetical protein
LQKSAMPFIFNKVWRHAEATSSRFGVMPHLTKNKRLRRFLQYMSEFRADL